MHRHPRSGRRGVRTLAPLIVTGLVLAACGGDDDAAPTTTAAPEPEAPAEDEPDAPADEADEADDADDASDDAGEEDAAAAADTVGFAPLDEIAAMCPADIAPDRLVFTTFPGQQEAMGPTLSQFTDLTGIEIEWLENGLGDRLTKMAAERGSPTIDVALVPIGEVPALLANGIIEETNTSLPNYEQLIPQAKFEGGYGVSALQFGIAYNPAFISETPTSWLDLLDETYAGHIALPSMPNSGGYALLSMLSFIAGGDEADLTGAIDQVAAFKDSAHSFIGATPTVEEQINNGEIQMYLDIGGVAVRAALERDLPVEFVIPDEGAPVSINALTIPVGSPHLPCAEALVAFLLGEESQLGWAEVFLYGSTSSIIEFEPELTSRLFPAPGSDSIVDVDWAVIAANTGDTIDYWNRQVAS